MCTASQHIFCVVAATSHGITTEQNEVIRTSFRGASPEIMMRCVRDLYAPRPCWQAHLSGAAWPRKCTSSCTEQPMN